MLDYVRVISFRIIIIIIIIIMYAVISNPQILLPSTFSVSTMNACFFHYLPVVVPDFLHYGISK